MTHTNSTYKKTIKPTRKEALTGNYEATARVRKDSRQAARNAKKEAQHG